MSGVENCHEAQVGKRNTDTLADGSMCIWLASVVRLVGMGITSGFVACGNISSKRSDGHAKSKHHRVQAGDDLRRK